MPVFHLDHALLPDGWADDVSVDVDAGGRIVAVGPSDAVPDHRLGTTVPGVTNLHSHAFQRWMVGRTGRRSPGRDDFWSWREAMYRTVDRLRPEDVEAVATLAQVEMLESGFTGVCEFHYLHHAPDGRPYDDPAEMCARIVAAARRTGIALTLLPVLYRHGGFGGRAPDAGQRRFLSDLDLYARLVHSARAHLSELAHARPGIAPHSLRAVTTEEISEILPLAPDGPIHIHVAEQTGEVDASLAHLGVRPVAHLLDTQPVDARWCLIHATHLDDDELRRATSTGAVAGVCPVTEADLGDGLFRSREWFDARAPIGVGTDSNVRIDLADELRLLEYGRRLVDRRRNVLAEPGTSVGRTLFDAALRGGGRASAAPAVGIAPGARADFVVLDHGHDVLAGCREDELLDGWIFAGGRRVVRDVWVAGRRVVEAGRALARGDGTTRWDPPHAEGRSHDGSPNTGRT